jgi:hypothetical protein
MKKLVFTLLIATTALIGCGKDGGGGGGGTSTYGANCYGNNYGNNYGNTATSTQFQWRNGQCIDNRTNSNANPQLCPPPGGSAANSTYGNSGCGAPGYQQYPNIGYQQYPNIGYQQYPNIGYQQYPNIGGGGSSYECQYISNFGYYYKYEYFPGLNTYMCVEYRIGSQTSYPYGQTPYLGGAGVGAGVGVSAGFYIGF